MSAAAQTEPSRSRAYISLGSNINPEQHIPQAIAALKARSQVEALSSIWAGPAVGAEGPDFWNAALALDTALSAQQLKAELLRPLEAELGRVRSADRNAPRPIDLDILVFAGEVVDTQLWQQAHLAAPLAELLPGIKHPESGDVLASVADKLLKNAQLKKHREQITDWR